MSGVVSCLGLFFGGVGVVWAVWLGGLGSYVEMQSLKVEIYANAFQTCDKYQYLAKHYKQRIIDYANRGAQ